MVLTGGAQAAPRPVATLKRSTAPMAGGLAPQLVQANAKAKNALMTQTIKIRGFDGGEVERYFHEGKIKEIADYCESDIVNTYREWLRYQLFRGILSQDAFEASQQNLAATPDRCCGARPAFPAKVDELLRGEPEIGVGSVKAPAGVPGID
jgi:Predicted 3'-5' exonuclease related to the exonuclease domain of PolB